MGQRNAHSHLIAFDVPKHVAYPPIKEWSDQGEKNNRCGYRAACLSPDRPDSTALLSPSHTTTIP